MDHAILWTVPGAHHLVLGTIQVIQLQTSGELPDLTLSQRAFQRGFLCLF